MLMMKPCPKLLVLLLLAGIVIGCKHRSAERKAAAKDTVIRSGRISEPPGDSSLQRYLQEVLSKGSVTFLPKVIEAGQVWDWSDEDGIHPKIPFRLEIGGKQYMNKDIHVVYGGERNLKDYLFSLDTAMLFTLGAKKYCLVKGGQHMCNGSGCRETFHFILDLQRQRLHSFRIYDAQADYYVCDFNEDGKLDFLAQDYPDAPGTELDTPTLAIAFIPYTLSDDGYFVQMKDCFGTACYAVGTFKNVWAPREFKMVATNCDELCRQCH